MPSYNYLPGTIINTIDGGLVSPAVPQDDSILILGTAGSGPINTPYQVTDRGASFNTFGPKGSLERSIEECAIYSDNITAFRIGAKPIVLADVGTDTTRSLPTRHIYVPRARAGESLRRHSNWQASGHPEALFSGAATPLKNNLPTAAIFWA
jgi:hypothetical protein